MFLLLRECGGQVCEEESGGGGARVIAAVPPDVRKGLAHPEVT
jgi:hypothetical protein